MTPAFDGSFHGSNVITHEAGQLFPPLFAGVDAKNKKLRTFSCSELGGGRWIRTTEVSDNRFTVCPLWPLGNSPIFGFARADTPAAVGAGRRTRTPDLLITNQLLYQLSYTSISSEQRYYSEAWVECQALFRPFSPKISRRKMPFLLVSDGV